MLNITGKNIFVDKKNKIKIISNSSIFSKLDKNAVEQLSNISKLPNLYGEALGFPDLHIGYGVPIGSAFATDLDNFPIISPEAVGYDINCGISLVRTNLFVNDFSSKDYSLLLKELVKLPIGLSSDGLKINNSQLQDICYEGLEWAYKNSYADKYDKLYTDHLGSHRSASFLHISKEAIKRGKQQVGTLGEGNHFIDLVYVDNISNRQFCKTHQITKGQLMIMLHTGSRGFGHQVATDYVSKCEQKSPFAYLDFNSKIGQEYYTSMCAASNYAFVNRAVLRTKVADTIKKTLNLGRTELKADLLYDLTHNNASIEVHNKKNLLVHRKGAVRCLLPKALSEHSRFLESGAPAILPGSMLDTTHVLLPKPKVEKETLSTIAHGCGRQLSRKVAKEKISADKLKADLLKKEIFLSGHSENTLREEQPSAYKPSTEVIDSLVGAGLCKKAFSLKPKVVVTG